MNQPTGNAHQEHQAGDATYQVILNGVRPNVLPAEAKTKLAAMFKATAEQIDKVLATPNYVVKKAISLDLATGYKLAIEAAGGACTIVPEQTPIMALDVDLPTAASTMPTVKAAANDAPTPMQSVVSIFKIAVSIVFGKAAKETYDFTEQPDLTTVRNGTAWLAAFSPTLSGVLVFVLSIVLHASLETSTMWAFLQLMLLRFAIMYLLIRIDEVSLHHQGFNTVELGMVRPAQFPLYLFSRAKVFGQSKAYAITWCVTFGLELLFVLQAMNAD